MPAQHSTSTAQSQNDFDQLLHNPETDHATMGKRPGKAAAGEHFAGPAWTVAVLARKTSWTTCSGACHMYFVRATAIACLHSHCAHFQASPSVTGDHAPTVPGTFCRRWRSMHRAGSTAQGQVAASRARSVQSLPKLPRRRTDRRALGPRFVSPHKPPSHHVDLHPAALVAENLICPLPLSFLFTASIMTAVTEDPAFKSSVMMKENVHPVTAVEMNGKGPNPVELAQNYLDKFQSALDKQDTEAIVDLFAPNGWWRDILVRPDRLS